jgi:hypothetical protein
MVRVTLPDRDWRRLRLEAADKNVSLTWLVNAILQRESAKIQIRELRAETADEKGGRR